MYTLSKHASIERATLMMSSCHMRIDEIIITSFPANSGLIRCLVPHGRAS